MQRRNPFGLFLLQPYAQEIGEQMVIAPPAAYLVQGYQEQVGALGCLQHLLAVGSPGECIA